MERARVVVVGLGAMGSAALYQLARRGVDAIGIDRYSPPHTLGSTHGDTRITRQAIGEGTAYVPLVLRSHELWRELEAESGADILTTCGALVMSAASVTRGQHGADDFFGTTVAAASMYGIPHELLDADGLRERFPQFSLHEEHRAYYEPGGGFVRPEAAVTAQLSLAERHGARVQRGVRVTALDASEQGVVVHTSAGSVAAEQAIVAAGPWIRELMPAVRRDIFTVNQQALHWFDAEASFTTLTSDRMPVFIWELGGSDNRMFYGFPAIDGPRGGLKVATEQYVTSVDADEAVATVSPEEVEEMYRLYVDGRLPIGPVAVRGAHCLYTVTPDHGFVIDRHPVHPNVLVASPCSGHGFKHSAAIGEALAQWVVDGQPVIDVASFGFDRFDVSVGPH